MGVAHALAAQDNLEGMDLTEEVVEVRPDEPGGLHLVAPAEELEFIVLNRFTGVFVNSI